MSKDTGIAVTVYGSQSVTNGFSPAPTQTGQLQFGVLVLAVSSQLISHY